jgi:hypothetical protein
MTRDEQHDAMCEFCRRCIQAAWAIDGADVQEWAQELGLTYSDKATKRDCEDFSFEGEPGDPIYRFERWLERPTQKEYDACLRTSIKEGPGSS